MQLSDTQRTLLEAAAKQPQKLLVDYPDNLKGGARIKVLASMQKAQLIAPSTEVTGLYVATDLGLEAIGHKALKVEAKAPPTKREGTKQAILIELLRRAEGATLVQMTEATGWLTHTVRGALAGALKKKLSLEIVSEKQPGNDRIYRITTKVV